MPFEKEESITFSNLQITDTTIVVDVEYSQKFQVSFSVDRAIPVSSTQVALALATLCVGSFSAIVYDFEVEETARATIANFTGAQVESPVTADAPKPFRHEANVLSFSGGFDSLSAWRIMPSGTNLVSLDFGGWFERESEFFGDFDTLRIRTNLRSLPSQMTSLARNHWSFMAVGAILTANYFNARYHTFGSILGESLSDLSGGASTLPVLDAVGMTEVGYARGLTEVGTASVIVQSDPLLVSGSLKSLAGPRDRKKFRKTALCQTVSKELGIDLEMPKLDPSKSPRITFGDDYASSLVALYCISRGDADSISPLFSGLPDSALELGEDCNLNFMGKFNWDQYQGVPSALRADLWNKFDRFGLEPYSQQDWGEVEVVREYMAKMHSLARR